MCAEVVSELEHNTLKILYDMKLIGGFFDFFIKLSVGPILKQCFKTDLFACSVSTTLENSIISKAV